MTTFEEQILSRLDSIEALLSRLLGGGSSSSVPSENAQIIAMAMSGNRAAAKAAALAKAKRDMALERGLRKVKSSL